MVNPGWGWWPSWLDVYHNLRLVPKINAPVLVMHVRALLQAMSRVVTPV